MTGEQSPPGVMSAPRPNVNWNLLIHGKHEVRHHQRNDARDLGMDLSKLKPVPDRPRIFMSSKSGKVVIVFPNGEIVEGMSRSFKYFIRFNIICVCLFQSPI